MVYIYVEDEDNEFISKVDEITPVESVFIGDDFEKMKKQLSPKRMVVVKNIKTLGVTSRQIIKNILGIVEKKSDIHIWDKSLFICGSDPNRHMHNTIKLLKEIWDVENSIGTGRPRIKVDKNKFEHIMHRHLNGELTVEKCAEKLGLSLSTFYRRKKEFLEGE